MKALIIDDEKKARSLLSALVNEYCPDIEFLDEAEDLLSGIEKIKTQKPDLVFLDIEMPTHSGIEILDLYKGEVFFNIIFTTAYSEYALKAFEMNAIDYLLKPIRPSLLKEAVQKAYVKVKNENFNTQLNELKSSFNNNKFAKIGLPVSNGILFVKIEDIILMEADGMYTKISTSKNETHLVSKPLKHFVDILTDQKEFYRPHRSFLINMNYIKQYVREDGNYIIMENDANVSISKDKKDAFFQLISSL